MNKKEKIEEFLKELGTSSNGIFYIVCGKCGVNDIINEASDLAGNIEHEIYGHFSDYTGHLWDTVNIKCRKCGNAISFDK